MPCWGGRDMGRDLGLGFRVFRVQGLGFTLRV